MTTELLETPVLPPAFSQPGGEKVGYDVKTDHPSRKTFTTPDHPAFKHLEKLKSQVIAPEAVTTTTVPPPYHRHDPHEKPQFTLESFNQPVSPVLYLPPLISSLPETLPPLPVPDGHPPMITETRLPDIDPVSLSLHKALHFFRPYDTKYASAEYKNAFNWEELVLPEQESREWYCVAFRSKRKDGSDGTPLYEADKKAHEEAVHNGGLLMYWYGVPDPDTGLNLATCIWQSRAHAVAANSRPHHIQAMRLAKDAYEVYDLERYVLKKVPGETRVFIDEYNGGAVGW